MLRVLPFVVATVLTLYCLVEIVQADRSQVRALPKTVWAALVLVPFAGALAWLWLGRPRAVRATGSAPAAQLAPDDDPDFLRRIGPDTSGQAEFRRWEEDLLREDDGDGHKPE